MKKKIKPRWFRLFKKPTEPIKPKQYIERANCICETEIEGDGRIKLSDLPEGTTEILISCGYETDYIELRFYGEPTRVLNIRYEDQMKMYEQSLKQYQHRIEEWNSLKKDYEVEAQKEKVKKEIMLLKQLKGKSNE